MSGRPAASPASTPQSGSPAGAEADAPVPSADFVVRLLSAAADAPIADADADALDRFAVAFAFAFEPRPPAGKRRGSASPGRAPPAGTASSRAPPPPPAAYALPADAARAIAELRRAYVGTVVGDPHAAAQLPEPPAVATAPAGLQRTPAPSGAPAAQLFVTRAQLPALFVAPFAAPGALPRFLALLRHLRPVYPPELFSADWWEPLLLPVLLGSRWRPASDAASALVGDMLAAEPGDPDLVRAAVAAYVDEAGRAEDLFSRGEAGARPPGEANIEAAAREASLARPRDFFAALAPFFSDPSTRIRAAGLLARALRRENVSAHLLAGTPLLDLVLASLQTDVHPALVASLLSTLVFLLPRIPTSLPPLLPRLFRIMARAALWEDALARGLARAGGQGAGAEVRAGAEYARRSARRCAGMLFTHLYGMWPCGLAEFCREMLAGGGEPREGGGGGLAGLLGFGKGEQAPVLERVQGMEELVGDFEGAEWAERRAVLERVFGEYFRQHTVHPSLFSTTAAAELAANAERFAKMDPDEIAAECLGRRNRTAGFLDDDGAGAAEPEAGSPAEIAGVSEPGDPPAVPAPPAADARAAVSLGDVLAQYEHLRGLTDHRRDPLSSAAEDADAAPRNAVLPLLLLLNELNLELYLRQVHLAWIRRLRRGARDGEAVAAEVEGMRGKLRAAEAAVRAAEVLLGAERAAREAERERAAGMVAEARAEAARARGEAAEGGRREQALREAAAAAAADTDAVRARLEEANGRIFELETRISVLEPRAAKAGESEAQAAQMVRQLAMWELDTKAGRAAAQRARELEGEKANAELAALDQGKEVVERERALAESRTFAAALASKLESAEKRLEKVDLAMKEQNTALSRLRLGESEKLKVLEEKYQTVRGINLQLQSRIGSLMAEMEQIKASVAAPAPPAPSPSLPSKSLSDSSLLPNPRAPSPLSSGSTGRPSPRTQSPSAPPKSPSSAAIRASQVLPSLPDEKKPSRTPSMGSGPQQSQLSAGLAGLTRQGSDRSDA
ncbi:Hamartin protein-domain-containing protein [Hyaloraphidium curvatum]|nr:Hamartin protein-domain-containing protein [Hyaloraphidium curvatum]